MVMIMEMVMMVENERGRTLILMQDLQGNREPLSFASDRELHPGEPDMRGFRRMEEAFWGVEVAASAWEEHSHCSSL